MSAGTAACARPPAKDRTSQGLSVSQGGAVTYSFCMIFQPNRTTEVFDTLLRSIQQESKVVSRKVYMYNNFSSKIGMKVLFSLLQAYLSHVASYVELLGIYSTRHLKVAG